MTHSASGSLLGTEFDDFLFAPIGVDRNGMVISVLSALARLGVDPWEEAAKLTRLPGATAAKKLTSLIAAQPDTPSAPLDSGTTAAHLLALLPRRASTNIEPRETLLRTDPASRPAVYVILAYVISVTFVLGAQYIIASRQQPAQVDKAHVPAFGGASTLTRPPYSGR